MYPLFNVKSTPTFRSPALIKILLLVATSVTAVTGIAVYITLHSPSKQQNSSVSYHSLPQTQSVAVLRRVNL